MTTLAELRRLPWHDSPVDSIAYDPRRRRLALHLTLCELPDGGPPGGQSGTLVFSDVERIESDPPLPLFADGPELAGEVLRLDWRDGDPARAELLLQTVSYPGRQTTFVRAVITFAGADWLAAPDAG
ncbi:MAG TPA: hypothetical protein VD886_16765 [Herpetosiphonaceae bacterium]|nr:hypothetical protein [Herpetosiphonaceae bacterium]